VQSDTRHPLAIATAIPWNVEILLGQCRIQNLQKKLKVKQPGNSKNFTSVKPCQAMITFYFFIMMMPQVF